MTIAMQYWFQAKFVLLFLVLVSLVCIFIGVNKCLEPQHSFCLTPSTFTYQHKYGSWQLTWDKIANIKPICENAWLERINLPYVGIKLHTIDSIIDNISPRLASRLIHEQRPLIHFAIQHQLISFEESIINFSPYKIQNNKHDSGLLKGPKAAFMHQVTLLHKAYGYHLFLPQTACDRAPSEFSELLNDCLRNYKNY